MEMKREELDIVIAEDGTVTIQVNGVKGKRCLDATAFWKKHSVTWKSEISPANITRMESRIPTWIRAGGSKGG